MKIELIDFIISAKLIAETKIHQNVCVKQSMTNLMLNMDSAKIPFFLQNKILSVYNRLTDYDQKMKDYIMQNSYKKIENDFINDYKKLIKKGL